MDYELPQLADEKAFRYEEGKKNEMKLEKINKFDPFTDEQDYLFYNCLADLKPYIPSELLDKKPGQKEKIEDNLDEKQKQSKNK